MVFSYGVLVWSVDIAFSMVLSCVTSVWCFTILC